MSTDKPADPGKLLPGDTIEIKDASMVQDLHENLNQARAAYAEAGRNVAVAHERLFDHIREACPEVEGWDFVVGKPPGKIRLIRHLKEEDEIAEEEMAAFRKRIKERREKKEADAKKPEEPPQP